MDIELISVETDLLLTDRMAAQTAYIVEKCAQLGCQVVGRMNVEERNIHLADMIQASLNRVPLVLIMCANGADIDLVRTMVARDIWHRTSVSKEELDVRLERHGGEYPAFLMQEAEKKVILLPGDEQELQDIFEKELFCILQKEQTDTVYSATIKMCDIEVDTVRKLVDSIREKNPLVSINVTEGTGEVLVRVCACSEEEHTAKKLMKPVMKLFQEKLGDYIYTTDDTVSLEASVLSLLKERDLTLTTAESLTGGLLAAKFTAVPGASEVFKQGFVTYCNRAKRKLLDVKKTTLKEYGAVSERTAKEMAKNGVFATGTDACVSLTGLAGPAAEEGKPVGLVYIACCYKNRTIVREYHFKGNRSQIREQSAMQALVLLRKCILADQ